MIRIGIDIMGGDYAPLTTLGGVDLAMSKLDSSSKLYLIGDASVIEPHLLERKYNPSRCELVVASEVISMDEHPVKALQQKTNSSLSVGFSRLSSGEIDVFASAGHSGAVMVGALQSVKQVEGVLRPCVASPFPLPNGNKNILLDVGINVDCKPEMLVQFAKLGEVYARKVFHVERPRIALLNTGTEKSKGSLLYQRAHELLEADTSINFIGNLEPREFFEGTADVTVCDGFTGNILLKQAEGFYKLLQKRNIQDDYLSLFNYEEYGGTPVLGLNGNVILGHGISNEKAICNMILAAESMAQANLANHIKEEFK